MNQNNYKFHFEVSKRCPTVDLCEVKTQLYMDVGLVWLYIAKALPLILTEIIITHLSITHLSHK